MTVIIKNIKTIICHCDNCGNEWSPNTNSKKDLPKVCPKCKSYNWNKNDKSIK